MLLLGGCSTVTQAEPRPRSTALVASTIARALTTTSPSRATADPLEALLITSVPAEYSVQPDSVDDTGPSDLAKAAADETSAAGEAALRAAGFVRGYQRAWKSVDGNKLTLFVYQFDTATGASSYFAAGVAEAESNRPKAAARFDIGGIPNAVGYSLADRGYAMSQVAFTKGAYEVELQVAAPGKTTVSTQQLVRTLALDQSARL